MIEATIKYMLQESVCGDGNIYDKELSTKLEDYLNKLHITYIQDHVDFWNPRPWKLYTLAWVEPSSDELKMVYYAIKGENYG